MDLPGYDRWKLATPPEYEEGVEEQENEHDDLITYLDDLAQKGIVDPVAWLRLKTWDFANGHDVRLVESLAKQLAEEIERCKLPEPKSPDDDIRF